MNEAPTVGLATTGAPVDRRARTSTGTGNDRTYQKPAPASTATRSRPRAASSPRDRTDSRSRSDSPDTRRLHGKKKTRPNASPCERGAEGGEGPRGGGRARVEGRGK